MLFQFYLGNRIAVRIYIHFPFPLQLFSCHKCGHTKRTVKKKTDLRCKVTEDYKDQCTNFDWCFCKQIYTTIGLCKAPWIAWIKWFQERGKVCQIEKELERVSNLTNGFMKSSVKSLKLTEMFMPVVRCDLLLLNKSQQHMLVQM